MQTPLIILLFVAAVLNSTPIAEGSSWSIVVSESGQVEILDLSKTPEDSNSTLAELKAAVIFHLYTVSNPDTAEVIYLGDDDTLAASNFDASKPTRIVIHGWMSSATATACTIIREAYLGQGDYNVIAVDWSAYAGKDYVTARTKIVAVGEYIGLMIDYLGVNGMDIDDLIVIGHSLGAHIAAVGCRSAIKNVANLIGLDPAGPLFYVTDTFARLTSTDANFVQVIHTNAGMLGYQGEIGDVDFWPNGGTWQTGCSFDIVGLCSHQRAYFFFAESITAGTSDSLSKFVATTCKDSSGYCASESTTYFGGPELDTNAAAGQYYFTTNSASPYAQG